MTDEEADARDRDLKLVRSHVAQLSEHFDSVQVFAQRHDPELNGTVNVVYGSGNWFSRYGLIKHWIVKEDESARQEVRRDGEG